MRKIEKVFAAKPALEGAGVSLNRGFGYHEVPRFDPFLLFDDFSNTEATRYQAGFPMHPHRGMETVTYILEGEVAHKDSLGNEGVIGAGDVQWMTAGSGIVHEEMPVVHEGGIRGFQLWVNLPEGHKMMPPRYQEIKRVQIPVVEHDGALVRIIAGTYNGAQGPVTDLVVSPTYFDVTLASYMPFIYPTSRDENFFIYVFEGRLSIRDDRTESWLGVGDIGLLTKDFEVKCSGGKDGARFLLIGGTPLNESVTWYGPMVMNTQEEIDTALKELRDNTFIKR